MFFLLISYLKNITIFEFFYLFLKKLKILAKSFDKIKIIKKLPENVFKIKDTKYDRRKKSNANFTAIFR